MSVFLGGQTGYQTVDLEKIKVATIQYDAQNTTYQKILLICDTKCLPHEYGEADLNTGEQSCVDRCVSKFFQANQMIGKEMQYNRQFNINKMPEYQKVKLHLKNSPQ